MRGVFSFASVLALAFSICITAAAAETQATAPTELSWSAYLTQSFYHASLVPLTLLTVALAYAARPATNETVPAGFRRFQWSYLTVWGVCVAADWLQGPYVYALYAAYGFSSREIAELFVAGFGSSLVFGCFVGSFTDRFGRKRCCLAYCVLYIMSCMTKHFKQYSILMLGRVTGGIATSMLFSCFECWMVSEHLQRNRFSGGLLDYLFGLMFTVMYCVAVASGLAGQLVADATTFAPVSEGSLFHTGGYCAPFDLAIACLLVGMVLIAVLFEENYGEEDPEKSNSVMQNLQSAGQRLLGDTRTLLLCVVVASFESSMFAFVFNWTPALNSKDIPPPHGLIFALFMLACMCGASASTLLASYMTAPMRLMLAFAAGVLSFVMASLASAVDAHLQLSFAAFMLFEFCVGMYFPSIGVLKSDIVPEQVRGTMYNLYRVPLNAIVVVLLLSDISMATCFKLNAVLLSIALLSVLAISGWFGSFTKHLPKHAALAMNPKEV